LLISTGEFFEESFSSMDSENPTKAGAGRSFIFRGTRGLSVWAKIAGAFALVLVLLVVIGGIGWYAINMSKKGLGEYREMARDCNLTDELQSHMLMVRMKVKDYLVTNSEEDIQQYHQYKDLFDASLVRAMKEIQNPDRAEKIKHISNEIVRYEVGVVSVWQ